MSALAAALTLAAPAPASTVIEIDAPSRVEARAPQSSDLCNPGSYRCYDNTIQVCNSGQSWQLSAICGNYCAWVGETPHCF